MVLQVNKINLRWPGNEIFMTYPLQEVLICTKDRPYSLQNSIQSVLDQDLSPTRILIIDSSSGQESQELVRAIKVKANIDITYFKTLPGLTKQRNFGIANLLAGTEIIHFIDDDSILYPNYIHEMMNAFTEVPTALGIGGSIVNLPVHNLRKVKCYLGLDSPNEGVVLKNGINVMNFSGQSVREVDWVSGCSMSFRKEVFRSLSFDENRKGNGVGEDVDFCLQVQKYGKIYWNPKAKLFHDQSPINRLNQISNRYAVLNHRLKLADDGMGSVETVNVRSAFFLESLIIAFHSPFEGEL